MSRTRRGFIAAAIGAVLCPLGIQLSGQKKRIFVVHEGETKTIRGNLVVTGSPEIGVLTFLGGNVFMNNKLRATSFVASPRAT